MERLRKWRGAGNLRTIAYACLVIPLLLALLNCLSCASWGHRVTVSPEGMTVERFEMRRGLWKWGE